MSSECMNPECIFSAKTLERHHFFVESFSIPYAFKFKKKWQSMQNLGKAKNAATSWRR